MKNVITRPTLSELADLLCDEINSRSSVDCFKTIHLVFPNLKIQQWFKAYWLNTQGDAVLLNVSFETLDSILPLITDNKYKLISSNNLRQIIINILSNKLVAIDKEYEKYYENSAVKLYDFADSLTKLYLDYYKDNFEDIKGWGDSSNFEYALYEKIVEICKTTNLGTIEKPVAISKKINDFIYLELIRNSTNPFQENECENGLCLTSYLNAVEYAELLSHHDNAYGKVINLISSISESDFNDYNLVLSNMVTESASNIKFVFKDVYLSEETLYIVLDREEEIGGGAQVLSFDTCAFLISKNISFKTIRTI